MKMKALCLLIFVQLLLLFAPCSARGNPGNMNEDLVASPPVQLRRLSNHVVMDNGLAQITLSTPGGMIDGIGYKGINNLLEPEYGPSYRGYWDLVWSTDEVPKIAQDRLSTTNFSVIAEDENIVELSFTRTWNPSSQNIPPMNIDKRYVMLRGSPGFYTYSIYERLEGMPGTTIAQTRVSFKLSEKLFDYMAISDERQRYMPTRKDRKAPRSVELAYHEARLLTNPSNPSLKGEVDDKFQYSKDNKDNLVHGWISDETGVGFWVISPSFEYRSGGPFKQELTSHTGPTSLAVFFSNHYSGKELDLHFGDGEAWKKVYGPVFVYLNSASTKNVDDLHSTLWTDAKQQASIEQQSWPYSFPLSNDYPHADQRGTVRGRLQVSDRYMNQGLMNAESAYVGLAPKGNKVSWQKENKGYQFWNQTDAEGNFMLKGVRSGNYNLFASVPGHIGRYKYKFDVTIMPGSAIELGDLIYKPPRFGPTLWEIGIPDGTAAEFHIPDATLVNNIYINHDKFRQYGLWDRYTDLYPDNDLVYNVGTSNYSKDWFFSQVTRKIDDEYHPTTWQINFDLPNVVASGTYTLQLALASTNLAQLRVYVNTSPAEGYPLFRVGQIGHDNAIARHAIHGLYWLFDVQIPGRALFPGRNKILLNLRTGSSPFIGTMYDYIRLEGPPLR
ncbi:Rhamnogalacturonan endolyase [Heracleum sosnowskyi]|uniref:rhamnogalacturonan endolyase n=1 Tax=Heracleum sosnowskyi TaxID=360622 RepID=A0AAD8GUQ2_9APIA|nr:Rhamnogalacturonan endolyase [Heracleum sosnowskyi]